MSRYKLQLTLWGAAFSLPWIIGFFWLTLIPMIRSAYYSFTNYSIIKGGKWVGWKNYIYLFTKDRLFSKAVTNTLYITFVGVAATLLVALMIAMLLNSKVRFRPLFRTIFYIPSILPTVASSLIWMWILNSKYGLLNSALNGLGIRSVNWLGDARYTKPALVIMGIWGCGNVMIIFLAALGDVPQYLYEAAEIDGAGGLNKFRHITLPSLSPTILFQVVTGIISGFQYFTQAYIISNAGGAEQRTFGPENSMLFYGGYMYNRGFGEFNMGLACAMAWLLFLAAAVVTAVILKSSRHWVYYGGE